MLQECLSCVGTQWQTLSFTSPTAVIDPDQRLESILTLCMSTLLIFFLFSFNHRSLIKCDLDVKGTDVHITVGAPKRQKVLERTVTCEKRPVWSFFSKTCQTVFMSNMNQPTEKALHPHRIQCQEGRGQIRVGIGTNVFFTLHKYFLR